MYQVLMIHILTADSAMYLGAIGIVLPSEDDNPVAEVEQWWEDFNATKPESSMLFIDWLEADDRGKEVMFDDESPNTPLQVYLRDTQ